MSVYFIADIRIKDPVEYQNTPTAAPRFLKKHKGRYLAVDDRPEVLESSGKCGRLVMIEFRIKKRLTIGIGRRNIRLFKTSACRFGLRYRCYKG